MIPVSKDTIVEDNMKKVSIIIPAYNAGKFLTVMLDSIAAQTYTNIEVIVAYDIKSTDNTLDILKSYKKIHTLIIDEAKDSSSGQARNRGFGLATGEYIIFLDADDKIIPTYIADLVNVFNKFPELNVVCGKHIPSSESEIDKHYNNAIESTGTVEIYTQSLALKHLMYEGPLVGGPWVWLVKRDYLVENEICFPNYSHGDDTVWVFKLLLNSNNIGYYNKVGYIFIQHSTSITNRISSPIDYWDKYEKHRLDISKMLEYQNADIALDFQNLELRRLVRMLTVLPYHDFQKILEEKKIEKLYITKNDRIISRISIITFNIYKYAYWRILNLKKLY